MNLWNRPVLQTNSVFKDTYDFWVHTVKSVTSGILIDKYGLKKPSKY